MHNIIKNFGFSGYKSFAKGNTITLNGLMPINVLIGKNNCGKSSILDIISSLFDGQKNEKIEQIYLDLLLSDTMIRSGFSDSIHGGAVPGENQYAYGQKYIDKLLRVTAYDYKYIKNIEDGEIVLNNNDNDRMYNNWEAVGRSISRNMEKTVFFRLNADRNIVPEKENSSESIDSSGRGTSNLIRKIINHSQYDEKLIEEKLLNALNQIMTPESVFTRIRVQQIEIENEVYWEVFLEEKNGRFPLSQSGSGLKTVILVLINLLILPNLKQYRDKHFIYAFEEIENNLHPALQRRIFEFIYRYSVEQNITVFLTTHSHVAINSFFGKDQAQLYHVNKDIEQHSFVKQIDNYIDKVEILDDLDIKASDLLQSNGIIWVEGPSDRIYIKKWLEIFCNNEFIENRDYQFLYYGGRILFHYEAATHEKDTKNLINVLLTNRNAAIVMDSDKRSAASPINSTKKRVKNEFEANGLLCWTTKGKEIENYISYKPIRELFPTIPQQQCGKYELFSEYIKIAVNRFNKVTFAHQVSEQMTRENSVGILDLENMVSRLHNCITKWN